ncbi:protein-disulfide reductase DsbD family protein [Dyella lutea]|uniref:Protein-disulfide reductase DsbD n=1 Tax=Dyella lutea TaxID=2950441 RepID=A0ABT1F717_9GAMM|nr:protein-disulfide reductase DsbD [Dyella lutea]MCP1373176.1 protein-disulfide reductase DsbD [Dyella lutea]
MRLINPGRLVARLLLAALSLSAGPALAQDTSSLLPVTEAYKLSADASQPGVLKLHWDIAPDYYLYRGRMKFTAGEGITLGTAQLPDGDKHHDEYLGDVETYHHGIDARLPYTAAAGATRLQVAVQFQGCHEVDPKICYPPHTEKLDLPLPAAAAGATSPTGFGATLGKLGAAGALGAPGTPLPPEQAFRLDAVATAPDRLLLRWSMPHGYYLYRDKTELSTPGAGGLKLQPAWPAGTHHQDDYQGETVIYYDEVEVPVGIAGDLGGRHQLSVQARFQGCQDGGICYPVMTRTLQVSLPAAGAGQASASTEATGGDTASAAPHDGLLLALLLALGGGLVLNLMPCVLPVLSIKAVSLLESGESPARARRHALTYTAGVMSSFAVLGVAIVGLRAAGHALGWGAQLQQPLVVALLACVMFAVGLSMSGVVQFGASLGNTGAGLASRSGPAGDFFTGVLAVVVASPCTAPFMGSALAYAFAAPIAAALAVFLMLGVGLALPFLLVGFVPSLARRLPRPGRWMETLKQVLAFPMYLTAVWLAWVLAHQRGADAIGLLLVAMVLLAMALWWFERSRGGRPASRLWVLALLALTVVPLYYLTRMPPPSVRPVAAEGVVAYSPAKLAELRAAGTPVFVDMTADWCVTCKANEHTVLDTDRFRTLLQRTGAVYMKGDWTDVNPTIAAFLQQYHSPGVPLYVVFPKGGGEGKALPTVLTAGIVEQALTEASH